MADDYLFLLPIVIDDTYQSSARVPEKFLTVQWLKAPGGLPTPALDAMCRRIASGRAAMLQPVRKPLGAPSMARAPTAMAYYPAFPARVPGENFRFSMRVVAWAFQMAWIGFKRLPRWIRILVYVWLTFTLISRGCSLHRHAAADISPATAAKLQAIAQQYQGSANKADIAKLGTQIASEIAKDTAEAPSQERPLLAIPFIAPAGDAAASKLADSTFAMVYGRLAISRGGRVALTQDAPASGDLGSALERARANHSSYVLFGAVENAGTAQALSIKIASVEDREILWSKSYPIVGADPAKIAAEVDSKMPSLKD
jgi:TolB-like protein